MKYQLQNWWNQDWFNIQLNHKTARNFERNNMKPLVNRPDDLITTVVDVAKYIGKGRTQTYERIQKGIIKPIQVFNGDLVFDKKQLDKIK